MNKKEILKRLNPIVVIMVISLVVGCSKDDPVNTTPPDSLPDVDSAKFSNPTDITNPYYGPHAGQTYVYEVGEVGKAPEEDIRIKRKTETEITGARLYC